MAALVAGVLGFTVLPLVGTLVAAGLGAAALAAIRREPDRWGGHGLAITGLVMGVAFGVVPAVGFFAFVLVVSHHRWAAGPLALAIAYGVLVIAVAARRSRAVLGISSLGVVGGAVALVAAAFIAYGAAILFTHLIYDLVKYVFNSTKCAVTHGGGTGKHCTSPRK